MKLKEKSFAKPNLVYVNYYNNYFFEEAFEHGFYTDRRC